MKVLVTGSSGLIGSRFVELNNTFDLLTPSTDELDITDPSSVKHYFQTSSPEVVINLAAYTNTEKSETDSDSAIHLNATAVEHIMQNLRGAKLVQISTDFVFDGENGDYSETDIPNPQTVYGQTKLDGEKAALKASDNLVVRTSYPYRAVFAEKSDCVRWMLPKLSSGETLTLVNDQMVTPTFVDDFVRALITLIQSNAAGIYHLAGSECLSFYEMGEVVCETWGFDKGLLKPISLEEFRSTSGRKAKAPMKSCLNTDKVKSEFGITLSDFKTGLAKMKQQEVV